ncbi:unnamed protein product [Echinostoma caproni]|uniref:Protocadherin-1 n=1 Tax=Echinostoma caproni TaxID=27848 RepID=A0A183A847_9TREM|nr:unnamed protein product [Echinostoma caproni]
MQTFVTYKWILCCALLVLGLRSNDGRVVRFVIDEELEKGSKIGSLLDHVPGAFNNLNFVRLSNTDDASNYFNVDQYSGDVNVAARLDREQLCTVKNSISNGDEDVTTSPVLTTPQEVSTADFRSPCELRFSVNCLSANTASGTAPVGGKVIELFDVVITLRDINDNGCIFVPHNRQTVHLAEDSPIGKTRVVLYSPFDPDDAKNGHSLSLSSIRFHNAEKSFVQKHGSIGISETEFHQMFRVHTRFDTPKKYSTDEGNRLTESNKVLIELELIQALDYEKQTNYSFALSANDGSGRKDHQCTLQVLLLVEDCNDNTPRFDQTQYTANLSENTPLGTLIVQLKATDADSGTHGAVTYSIVGSSVDDTNSPFYIHPSKGELRLQHRLNHRQKAKHKLTIQASNTANGTHSSNRVTVPKPGQTATVEINVLDVNDQAPKIRLFSPTGSTRLEVVEESPPGQDVAILDVTDRDVGQNAEVECHLANQSLPGALRMHFLDGPAELVERDYTKKRYKLTVVKTLDRERTAEVHFIVRCWDHGNPRQTTDSPGVLNVVDINDHAPQFEKDSYSISVSEDSDPDRSKSAFRLIQVHARDKDTGLNAQIRYRIDHEIASALLSLVKVDADTGVISSTGNLDRETMESFSLTVMATDMGDPPRSARCKVNVRILDYNDNAPTFSKSFYTFKLPENSPIGQLIGTLRVSDADSEQNSRITVRLEDGSESMELFANSVWNGLGQERVEFSSAIKPMYRDMTMISGKTDRLVSIPQIRVVSYQPHQSNTGTASRNGSVYEIQLYTNSIWDREALFVSRYRKTLMETANERGGFGQSTTSTRIGDLTRKDDLLNQTQMDPYMIVHLRAEDQGNPPLIKRVPVRIRVLDENDNSPTFLFPDINAVNISKVTVSKNEAQRFVFAQSYLLSSPHEVPIILPDGIARNDEKTCASVA